MRNSAVISILLINGSTVDVPITTSAYREWKLMEMDCYVLEFADSVKRTFSIGDYIEDEEFGKFYITEVPVPPTYDQSSGAYKYSLRFDAYYFLWKNYCFEMIRDNSRRSDKNWSLVDRLEVHVREVIRNLILLGLTQCRSYCIDGVYIYTTTDGITWRRSMLPKNGQYKGVENREAHIYIKYEGASIYDALFTAMCDAYDCECWVSINTIFLGKCEMTAAPLDFIIDSDNPREINMESVSSQKNSTEYANRLYVYGSTKNIPDTYRKEIMRFTDVVYEENDYSFKGMLIDGHFQPTNHSSSKMYTARTVEVVAPDPDSDYQYKYLILPIPETGVTFSFFGSPGTEFGALRQMGAFVVRMDSTAQNSDGTYTMRFLATSGAYYSPTAEQNISVANYYTDPDTSTRYTPTHVVFCFRVKAPNGTYDYDVKFKYRAFRDSSHNFLPKYFKNEFSVGVYSEPTKSRSYLLGTTFIYYTWRNVSLFEYYLSKNRLSGGIQIDGLSSVESFASAKISVYGYGTSQSMVERDLTYRKVETDDTIRWVFDDFTQDFLNTSPGDGHNVSLQLTVRSNISESEVNASVVSSTMRITADTPISTEVKIRDEPYAVLLDYFYLDSRGYFGRCYDTVDFYGRKIWYPQYMSGSITNGWFEIPDNQLNKLLIPSSWFRSDYTDDLNSISMVGEQRLMLPESYGKDYIGEDNIPASQLVERLVYFDGIFPMCALRVTSCEEISGSITQEYADGSTTKLPFGKWRLTLKRITAGGDVVFPFTEQMLTSNPLQAKFLTQEEEKKYSGAVGTSPCKLAGMTFGVEWSQSNVSGGTYTLVWNQDYGAWLPNKTLCPSVGDPLILIGWNVSGMEELGIIEEAEKQLLEKGIEYANIIQKDFNRSTHTCNMMSWWAQDNGILPFGRRVRVCPKEDEETNVYRVLGYRLKADFPYDTPQYTIGETEAFSRLKTLERSMKDNKQGASSSGAIIVSGS